MVKIFQVGLKEFEPYLCCVSISIRSGTCKRQMRWDHSWLILHCETSHNGVQSLFPTQGSSFIVPLTSVTEPTKLPRHLRGDIFLQEFTLVLWNIDNMEYWFFQKCLRCYLTSPFHILFWCVIISAQIFCSDPFTWQLHIDIMLICCLGCHSHECYIT